MSRILKITMKHKFKIGQIVKISVKDDPLLNNSIGTITDQYSIEEGDEENEYWYGLSVRYESKLRTMVFVEKELKLYKPICPQYLK